MDIWQWLRQTRASLQADGNEQLAHLINSIPKTVVEGSFRTGQLALPEALAGARLLNNTWLELFFRHWVLNGRLWQFKEGESALEEASALFSFAQQPENIACPQSICTAVDLASCYGNLDGKGRGPERIALCEASLKRIHPDWACHNCLTRELIDALVDSDRPAEALDVANGHLARLSGAGTSLTASDLLPRARALFATGAYAEILELLSYKRPSAFAGDNWPHRFFRECLLVRTLAAMERADEAWAYVPEEAVADFNGGSIDLVAGLHSVCTVVPEHNTYITGRRAAATLRHYHQVGAHRLTLDTLPYVVQLAVARGAHWSARRALDFARPHLAKLAAPYGAPEHFAELERLVAAMPAIRLPVAAASVLQFLGGRKIYERDNPGSPDNPERDLDCLLAAAEQLPADAALANAVGNAMLACGAQQEATGYLWAFVRAHPGQDDAVPVLMQALLAQSDYAGALALADFLREYNRAMYHWCHVQLALAQGRWDTVGAHAAQLIALDPAAPGAKDLWARAALKTGQFEIALALFLELTDTDGARDREHLNVMAAASALQQWDLVHAAAARLTTPLQFGGAGEDEPERIELWTSNDDSWVGLEVLRAGPTTARVTSLARTGVKQRVRDLVVFHPAPCWVRDETDYADWNQLNVHEFVHVLKEGGYSPSFAVEGVHPGDEQLAGLTAAFETMEWEWDITSNGYTMQLQDSGVELRGLYFIVAAPASVTPAVMAATLTELTARFVHPLCWPELAEAAGANAQWHRAVADRYGK